MTAVAVYCKYKENWLPRHVHVPQSERPFAAYTSGAAFDGLATGDIAWLIIADSNDKKWAMLAGRLVVREVVHHGPGLRGFDSTMADKDRKIVADRELSRYRQPFRADLVTILPWWHKQNHQGAHRLDDLAESWIQASWDAGPDIDLAFDAFA